MKAHTLNKGPMQRALYTMAIALATSLCASAVTQSVRAQELFEEAVEEAAEPKTHEQAEEKANQLYFSGRFVVNDADPMKSMPSAQERDAYPVDFGYFVTSLFDKGNRAAQRGEHEAAVKYFTALANATPQGALALRNMCTEYRALGKRDLAQKACGLALTRNGVVLDDYLQYVQLVVTQAEELSPELVADVDAVIEHMSAQNAQRAIVQDLKCRLGARLLDAARLQACTEELRRLNFPADKMGTYVWALAMLRGNKDEAKRQLALVKQAGVDSAAVESMAQAINDSSSLLEQKPLVALLLIAAALALVAAVYVRHQHKRARN